ncbi:MAG: polymerase [Desulfovibrionales bacterium]|nr:polymerase [Desulfovibrionales bacterium]
MGPQGENPARRVIHLDMDAFFASIEQLDFPEYRGRPLAVGDNPRGVVSAASYEIRRYGVHSAMSVAQARRLCPHGIFTPVRGWRYREVSREVMAVLRDFTPICEQASVDEAYLDVTGLERLAGPPEAMGRELKRRIKERTGLTASVGVAPNKLVAKIASDFDKPDGLTVVAPEAVLAFMAALPLEKIPGVGRRTLPRLHMLGLRTGADVQRCSRQFLEQQFGEFGGQLFERARGVHHRPVEASSSRPKSISAENTFERDTDDLEDLVRWLLRQSDRVASELRQEECLGRTVTLKLKFSNFQQITRSQTLSEPVNTTRRIYETAAGLLRAESLGWPVRLIGVGVSNLVFGGRQLSLLDSEDERSEKLERAVDGLREKFGKQCILRADLLEK